MYESVAKLPCGEVTVAKLPCGEVTGNRTVPVLPVYIVINIQSTSSVLHPSTTSRLLIIKIFKYTVNYISIFKVYTGIYNEYGSQVA